ncbi:PAS domain S-box protein [Acidovorax sp. LjRoot117]|uniref:PAS domain S-box protein n=1 Tax=Acidovorax sp. LjRoot117 TaxID=3342255 RepID=UPI003ECD58B4
MAADPRQSSQNATNVARMSILVALVVMCITLVAAVVAYDQQVQQNREALDKRFDGLKGRVMEEIAVRMRQYEYGLRGTRGAVAAAGDDLDHKAFMRYSQSRDFAREFPGARGFGYIHRVARQDEVAFVRKVRAEDWIDFSVHQFEQHAGDLYVIQYIEPLERNNPVVGLDIASEPLRLATAVTAMRSGQATLSGPITLLQDAGTPSRGLLLMLPVYRFGAATDTTESREQALRGWVYAPLQMDEVLRGLDVESGHFMLRIRDRLAPEGQWLYSSHAEMPAEPGIGRLTALPLFGREWEVDMRPTPAFVASLNLAPPQREAVMVVLLGLAATALAIAVLHLVHRSRSQLLEQARRAAIVQGSDDAIIVQTLQGIITDWNDGARRLFGYEPDEVLGHTAQELLVPAGREGEDESMLAMVAKGQRVKAYETSRRHRDGTLIDVSVSASPIEDSHGRIVGLAKTLRDVREVRAAALRVIELNATLEDQVRERTSDLESARHALQTVLDAMPSQIGYWGPDQRNRVANRAYGEWFDMDPALVPGMHLRELIGESMYEMSAPHVQAALRGEARMFEQTRRGNEGERQRHSLVHYLPDIAEGQVKGFYAFVHDVTELTESRLQLAAVQRDNAALLETLNKHTIVSVADRWGRIVDVNDAFCRISGFERDELMGRNHRIVNSGTHAASFWVDMWRTISAGHSWRAEVCNRSKSGALYWVDSVVAPFLDAQGRVEKYVSIRTDITDRKRTEMQLQSTLTLLRTVLEASTQVAIVATDAQGVVTVFNRGAELLLGEPAQQIIGHRNASDFVENGDQASDPGPAPMRQDPMDSIAPEVRMALIHTASQDPLRQWRLARADGGRVPVSLAVTRMADATGSFVGYLGIAHDVSTRLEQEKSLRIAMQQAREASDAKSRFLANMSHEIRTPMNAVIGLSYLLARTALDGEQQRMLQQVQVAGKALLAVINDVLDLSKIEAGEVTLETLALDMGQVVRDVSALIEPQAQAKGIAYVVDGAGPPDIALEGDSTRLRQVLINLLSNAVKFTDQGEVRLEVRFQELTADTVEVRFVVSDTGIGISEESRQRLFAPFVQADTSTTRRFGGTGLGLSIVKQLVELMDGHIELHSQIGQGSQFMVALPLHRAAGSQPATAPDAPVPEGQGLRGMSLLVVDDNEVNQEVAARILTSEGAQVSVARHGQAALDLLAQHPDRFDAVLMDVHMPVLDGLDATRRIRTSLGLLQLPVIGLTAGVSSAEREEALVAGMNAIVGKPFDPPMLVRTIRRHLPGHDDLAVQHALPPAAEPPADWPRVEGVSAQLSFSRLQGSTELLWQMLQRISATLDNLAGALNTAMPESATDARLAASRNAAAVLHDLKGMSGTVGAEQMHALASQAQASARRGDTTGIAVLTAQMQDMARQWALDPTISVQRDSTVAHGHAAALSPGTWEQIMYLQHLLATQDLDALEWTRKLEPVLTAQLGTASLASLQRHMADLDFASASALLARVAPPSAAPERGA